MSIAAMVTSALDGVTEFVRGVAHAMAGLVSSLNPAAGSSTTTTRSAITTADTGDDTSPALAAEEKSGIVDGTAGPDAELSEEQIVTGETPDSPAAADAEETAAEATDVAAPRTRKVGPRSVQRARDQAVRHRSAAV